MRIFLSSPSDLAAERKIVLQVIERLGAEFREHFPLEAIVWEHEPLLATEHFQEGLISPAECDLVVCMFWSRLGSPLPADKYHRPDGSAGVTGTEWEFQIAVDGYRKNGRPRILVYRKQAPVQVTLDDEAATNVDDECVTPGPIAIEGALQPDRSLAVFDGEDISGTWRLQVIDRTRQNTGYFLEWCLIATTQ